MPDAGCSYIYLDLYEKKRLPKLPGCVFFFAALTFCFFLFVASIAVPSLKPFSIAAFFLFLILASVAQLWGRFSVFRHWSQAAITESAKVGLDSFDRYRLDDSFEHFDITLREVIQLSNSYTNVKENSSQPTGAKSRWWHSIVLYLGAILVIIGIPFAFVFFWIPVLGFIPLMMGAIFIYVSRRLKQASATDVLNSDTRAPIIFLRSFSYDSFRVATGKITSEFFVRLNKFRRFEEAISERLKSMGPFVGIGEPGEKLQNLGAARAYFEGTEWQDAVKNIMDQSQTILMLPGFSRWVIWELETAIKNDHMGKLLILLPPSEQMKFSRSANLVWRDEPKSLERLKALLTSSFQGTSWDAAIGGLDLTDSLAIIFPSPGKMLVVKSNAEDKVAYELAIILCNYSLKASSAKKIGVKH